MSTAEDLIKLTLKAIGILGSGQTPRQEQLNDALTILNMMLGQWNRKRWLIPHLVESKKQSTGVLSYSVGLGADFNIPRPDRIEDAFVRLNGSNPSQPVDYPLTILPAREDYDRISIKAMGQFPYYAFYDAGNPIGTIYFWPVPSSQYEMHIFVKDTLAAFASLTTTINLPPEYVEPIYYNLAIRLAPTYGVNPKPVVIALAEAGLNTLRQANTQLASLRLPGVLTMNSRSASLPVFTGKPGI